MTTTLEKVNGTPTGASSASRGEPRTDPLAAAEAEAIRARTAAETEAARICAEAEAEAIRIKAAEENRKLRLANDRAERKAREDAAASEARIAEANRRRADAERARAKEARVEEERAEAEEAEAEKIEDAENSWKFFAVAFAVVCAIVALPVQMAAFWSDKAPWMITAPFMLEGAAWVVLRGAAAAVAAHRPHWHFRLIAWLLAFVAAGVNLWHGLTAFDPATAIGTAVASIAGPGVWDLYEHGRIRKRDGKLTWRERREQKKNAEKEAAEKAAKEEAARAEKETERQAAEEAAKKLTDTRAEHFPKVWAHAEKLAAALGETSVTEAVWRRAHRDIEGADPAESVDVIRARNVAERRVLAARSEAPGSTPIKVTNTQRVPHLPPASGRGSKTGPKVRGVRRSGDSPAFVAGARRQAAETARKAARRGADDTFREEAER